MPTAISTPAPAFAGFTEEECRAAAPASPLPPNPTATVMATPVPPGTVFEPDPEVQILTWPLPNVSFVFPPDGTVVHRWDINPSGHEAEPIVSVGLDALSGAGINLSLNERFGLDGKVVDVRSTAGPAFDNYPTPRPSGGGGGEKFFNQAPGVGDHPAAVSLCDNSGSAYTYEWHFTVIDQPDFVPFTDEDCAAGATATQAPSVSHAPEATPLPPGTLITDYVTIPRTWPAPYIIEVSPPDRTAAYGFGGYQLWVLFDYAAGSGLNADMTPRFALNGQSIDDRIAIALANTGHPSEFKAQWSGSFGVDQTATVSYCDKAGKAYQYTWHFN